MQTTRLRVTLRDVQPTVTRLLDVPVSTTLPELHDLLQVALGWTDCHLHQFIAGDLRWGVPSEDSWDEQELDERAAKLKDLPASFVYLYDLGDSWEHDVEVLGAGGPEPGLVSGEGACPPEDCGGSHGYEELLAALADPAHPEHEHMTSWSAHHSFTFDLAAADTLVRRTVGSVPPSVRAVLDVVGSGLKLTQAGKFPPAVVAELVARCPGWRPLIGVRREDNVIEAGELRDLLRSVGVLRVSNGKLLPTKAAGDDLEVVRRLRKRFPEGDFDTILATSAVAVLVSSGPQSAEELMGRVLPMVGRGWSVNGEPLDLRGLLRAWWGLQWLLRSLDLVAKPGSWDSDVIAAGPSALTLLPQATGLATLLRGRDWV